MNQLQISLMLLPILLAACDDPSRSPTVLSGTGENCTKTAECESGLKCIGFICVSGEPFEDALDTLDEVIDPPVDSAEPKDDTLQPFEDAISTSKDSRALSGEGESCSNTGNCEVDLICVDLVCVQCLHDDDCGNIEICTLAHFCCTPSCGSKECGDDGCGFDCGTCPGSNDQCSEGLCVCQPDCDGKECGEDGCGGSCGSCLQEGELCSLVGQCIYCDPVQNSPCPDGQYCTYADSSEYPVCLDAGSQNYGDPCADIGDCQEGICLDLPFFEEDPVCYRLCNSDSDCMNTDVCLDVEAAQHGICLAGPVTGAPCHLVEQNCLIDTDGCYFDGGGAVCMTAGDGVEGGPCADANDCAEGLTCNNMICLMFCIKEPGVEDGCDKDGGFPICKNYYAAQQAGLCHPE